MAKTELKTATEVAVVAPVQSELALLEQQTAELSVQGENERPLPPAQMGYEYDKKRNKFDFYLKLGKGLAEVVVEGDVAEFILAGPAINNKGLFDNGTGKFVCQGQNGAISPWIKIPKAASCGECKLNQWDNSTGRKFTERMSDGQVASCRDTLAIPMIYIGHRNEPEGPFELCYLIVSTKGLGPWGLFQKQFKRSEQASKFKVSATPAKHPYRVVIAVHLTKEEGGGNTYAVPSFSIVGDTNDPKCLHPDLYRKSLVIQLGYQEMLKRWGVPVEVDGDDITGNANNRNATPRGQEVRPDGDDDGVQYDANGDPLPF